MAAVVITGRGVVSPLGGGVEEFFDALVAGTSGIADGVAAADQFDPETVMTPKEARRADRFTQLAVGAAEQAAAEADLANSADPERIGVLMGTGIGGLDTLQSNCEAWIKGGDRAVSPLMVTMMMPNAAAGQIAMRLGVYGPGFSVSSACATGTHAIGEAKRIIERDEADVVLAGGTEAALVGLSLAAFGQLGAMSPTGESCPFDVRRNGFVMGEGAGAFVLESEEHAKARGATIYGRVLGYGASNDAFHITQPHPEGKGAKLAIKAALKDAGISASEVGHVNAHGTSTEFDYVEAAAVAEMFGEATPVTSCKGAIGHLLGAAGAVEGIAALESVRRGVIPPTVGLEQQDERVRNDVVAGEARQVPDLKIALSNSFGFGGQNACLVVAA
ncbi:MAG TPA: beta-ketoacyl-[acyl-carrier-protein] synthase family protein [Baekduia sp.]|nr:beta-ketoacyl-[acyl-carrier-protein] synthase family protein [Baekduia sp.]